MKRQLLTIGAAASLALAATACVQQGPTPVPPIYKPCNPAAVLFTVTLPVLRSEAEQRICLPTPPQRHDVLVPPVQPGSGAATQTQQINAMGGAPTANLPGDPAGYMRGRTVVVTQIPLVEGR